MGLHWKTVVLAGLATLLIVAPWSFANYWPFETRPGIPAVGCKTELWEHTHTHSRFRKPGWDYECLKVIGKVLQVGINPEDGDYKFDLDNGIHAEIVCVTKPTWTVPRDTCQNYQNEVALPHIGQTVEIVGLWVIDTHGWEHESEIHPISSVKIFTTG